MQDRYAFDVGDFAKLGLIRALGRGQRIGLLWYAYRAPADSTEAKNGDGRHVAYLQQAAFAACDPQLHAKLRQGLGEGAPATRTIARLIQHALLPRGTQHHVEHVAPRGQRSTWFAQAMKAVAGCSLVVADPDNGMARPGSSAEASSSRKHMLLAEAAALFARGQSLLLYHHLNRIEGSHAEQVSAWQERLGDALSAPVWALRFRRGSSRVFYLVAAKPHRDGFAQRIEELRASAWVQGGHFEPPTLLAPARG